MIDLVRIHTISGSGGNGAVSFRREKYVARGGPDGGDGGRGGDIILFADPGLTTLANLRYKKVYHASDGQPGGKRQRHGSNGETLELKVPAGTVVSVPGSDEHWDLDQPGMRVVVARGGEGGRGNVRFANSVRQAPGFAEKGLPGEDKNLKLELKLLADVGIIGLPNAGKSTLLRAVSRATPDVGDFPFTTLEPVLGVVDMGMDAFVMADLPGLIEGAHEGVGLGHQFLRHVERTRVLVHLLDGSAADSVADYHTVRREIELYDESMKTRLEVIAINKIDIDEAREGVDGLRAAFAPKEVLAISGATGEGTRELIGVVYRALDDERKQEARKKIEPLPVIRPREHERIDVEVDADAYVIRGKKAEEAALKLGDGGFEALDELQERLKRMGLERALRRAGAKLGDKLRVGTVELEWHG
ncbi:MAG TPA: GTPase ObgE [Dehalococcoidia bacterium]|jgi:GTP-binding protein